MKKSHLKRYIENKQQEHKEDIAREVRTYGQVRPNEAQVSNKGWKSYSKQKYPSEAFRRGYDEIDWNA